MLKTILKWIALVALFAYVFFAAGWARTEARKEMCTDIEVNIKGENAIDSVTKSGILAELGRYPDKIKGNLIRQINTKEIENYLEDMPQFEEVNCAVTSKGSLLIDVTPMVPAARVFSGSRSFYINKEGKEMNSKANFFVDVPVIGGQFNEKFRPVQVLPVVRFVENDPILNQLVGMVYASDSRNIYLVPRIHGHVINFGDTLSLPYKRDALMAFYKKVMPYKGWEEYDTISVKFHGQVVATRRDKSRRHTGGHFIEEADMEDATLPEI